MAEPKPEDVTSNTLHEDLRGGFTDLKATLIAGFASMPTREDSQEMIRLLREPIQILAYRSPELDALDARIQEQALELQQVLRALAEATQRFKDRGTQGVDGVANT